MQSAGKYATGAKRGKVCSRCQARESIQMVPSVRNTGQAETVKVLDFVSVVNVLVVRMIVKRDCIELRRCKRKHLLWLKYFYVILDALMEHLLNPARDQKFWEERAAMVSTQFLT